MAPFSQSSLSVQTQHTLCPLSQWCMPLQLSVLFSRFIAMDFRAVVTLTITWSVPVTMTLLDPVLMTLLSGRVLPLWAQQHCRISPSCFPEETKLLTGIVLFAVFCIVGCFWVVFSLCIFLYCFVCQYRSRDWLWHPPPKWPKWPKFCRVGRWTLINLSCGDDFVWFST